jgi:hypothetical protein
MADTAMPDEPRKRLGKLLLPVIAAHFHNQATLPGNAL